MEPEQIAAYIQHSNLVVNHLEAESFQQISCCLCRVYLKHHLVGAVLCPEPRPGSEELRPKSDNLEDQLRDVEPTAHKKKRKKKSKAKEEDLISSKRAKASAAV